MYTVLGIIIGCRVLWYSGISVTCEYSCIFYDHIAKNVTHWSQTRAEITGCLEVTVDLVLVDCDPTYQQASSCPIHVLSSDPFDEPAMFLP